MRHIASMFGRIIDLSLLYLLILLLAFSAFILPGSSEESPSMISKNFFDNFEENTGWTAFEELVDDVCYVNNTGNISRSNEYGNNGRYSLCVWANKDNKHYSNHISANKKLENKSRKGIWRYSVSAMIDPETAESGQTGPEFSIQNTDSSLYTHTAGIQYTANDQDPSYGEWAIWIDNLSGNVSWVPFLVKEIDVGKWYNLKLDVDYDNNRYISFHIQETGEEDAITVDLSDYEIAPERKPGFDESAFYITLESENKWKNCSDTSQGTYNYKVFYDQVVLEERKSINLTDIRREADYIVACQNRTYGAINNVYPGKGWTWIDPCENSMAILALLKASDILNDSTFKEKAQLAADYLVCVQNKTDGAWHDKYSNTTPETTSKSPRRTAEVMIALYKLGYNKTRYHAMENGSNYLMNCQNVTYKKGLDDGLLGGGINESGGNESKRWIHDNSYAYWAFKACEDWAIRQKKWSVAEDCHESAQKIVEGINKYFYDERKNIWYPAVEKDGNPIWNGKPQWIQYAPRMLDVPVEGLDSKEIGIWMHENLQAETGLCGEFNCANESRRLQPGHSFQAAMVWFDLDQPYYAYSAINGAEYSGLWMRGNDKDNNISGGWIDWIEYNPNDRAKDYERFIDTSFYAIAAWTGGYNFSIEVDEFDS